MPVLLSLCCLIRKVNGWHFSGAVGAGKAFGSAMPAAPGALSGSTNVPNT